MEYIIPETVSSVCACIVGDGDPGKLLDELKTRLSSTTKETQTDTAPGRNGRCDEVLSLAEKYLMHVLKVYLSHTNCLYDTALKHVAKVQSDIRHCKSSSNTASELREGLSSINEDLQGNLRQLKERVVQLPPPRPEELTSCIRRLRESEMTRREAESTREELVRGLCTLDRSVERRMLTRLIPLVEKVVQCS